MKDQLKIVKEKYISQDFKAVVDIFDRLEDSDSCGDFATLAMVAQSHYRLGNYEDAAEYFERLSRLKEDSSLQFRELAFELFRKAGNTWKALVAAGSVLKLSPRHQSATTFRRHHLFEFLLFDELQVENERTLSGISRNDNFIKVCELPFNNLMWCGDEKINSSVYDHRSPVFSYADRQRRRTRPHNFGDKIRIGYLSGDFSSAHATMILMNGVLENHDRSKFDITLYCNTPDSIVANDAGFREGRANIVDIKKLNDTEAHDRIRADSIDILVDLKGHTRDARIGLVNSGPAPIQVSWLGFPGSVTGIDCDYIIGDPIVLPDSSKPYYHEKFCRLPECYQPNDNRKRPLPPPMRRVDAGVPSDKFVFASFNNVKKISFETIGAWLGILQACPDSILWIMCADEIAQKNLLYYVKNKGVSAKRIIFAKPIGYEAHLARLQAADLCLDTFPYNGHTTTSDCLWAGLPVLTVKGTNFASRVSESLLAAIGLSELVADSVDEYVNLACELAGDNNRLRSLRQTLIHNRFSASLFDTGRFTRHLENAYEMMAERSKAGLDPDHFDVPALPPRESK
jgi:predicted O-linked N-acetylglucosamine transferase (SPINDLY family)